MDLDRASNAIEAGTPVAVDGGEWVDVIGETEVDEGVKFIIQNPPDQTETVSIRLSTAAEANDAELSSSEGQAFALVVGGHWEEDRYAGPVCAITWGDPGSLSKTVF